MNTESQTVNVIESGINSILLYHPFQYCQFMVYYFHIASINSTIHTKYLI